MAFLKFFKIPFATTGSQIEIPDDTQPSGVVSFNEGYGADYSKNAATDPEALKVERTKFNYLMNKVTSTLNQYQLHGVPEYITPDQYGTVSVPVPCPYAIYDRVRYDDGSGYKIYVSLVSSNTSLPTDTTKWQLLDNTGGSLVYPNATFNTSPGTTVVDGDAVYRDVNFAVFSKAQAIDTAAKNMVGIADVTNKRVILAGYVSLPTTLTTGAVYYLSESTPGAITTTAPSSVAVRVGVAISTSELLLSIVVEANVSKVLYAQVSFATNTTVSLPGGNVPTTVVFNQVYYDPNGWWVTDRFIPNKLGVFRVTGILHVISAISSNYISVYRNGQAWGRLNEIGGTNANITLSGSILIPIENLTDYIQLKFNKFSAGNTLVGDDAEGVCNTFQLEYVGPYIP